MADTDNYSVYNNDPRIPCKYGAKCYQKNSAHHEKYKHPNKRLHTTKLTRLTNKKQKTQELSKKAEKTPRNDISDSEDEKQTEEQFLRNELNQNDENNQLSKKKVQFIQENSKKTPKTLDKQKAHQDTSIQQISCNDISDSEDENQIEDQPVSNTSIEKDEDKQLDEKEVQASQGNFKRTPKTFDKGEFIKSKFLVEMPADFYQFWEYCKDLNNDDPSDALKDMSLKLVGPYDVLAGKFSDIIEPSSEQYLLHWRYYYDIPEFQTVIKGDDSSGFHIGYFRDTPNDKPVFMAKNSAEKNGEITCTGDNIFAAVFLYLEEIMKKVNPFKKMNLMKIQSSLKSKAEELDLSLSAITPEIKKRNNKIVTRCLNKAGLVVPYDRKTQQGYRELSVSSKKLISLLQEYKVAPNEKKLIIKTQLEEVFRWASIALDECDFGTGIELGWDLIYSGTEEFDSVAARFLGSSYRLLQRDAFAEIAEAHMKDRRKGCKLSII